MVFCLPPSNDAISIHNKRRMRHKIVNEMIMEGGRWYEQFISLKFIFNEFYLIATL